MRFGHIELFVKDLLVARKFYEDVLGFELVAIQGENFVWLKLGETEILLRPGMPQTSGHRYEDARIGLVMYTDDLPKTADGLQKRGLVFRDVVESEKCMSFMDPDGNWFQLVNPNDL